MFRVGETYLNGMGASVRIISADSKVRYGIGSTGIHCPIVGEVTLKTQKHPTAIYYYNTDGRYCGLSGAEYTPHSLISNDPTSEELELIRQIGDYCENKGDDEQLLKIIRALRAK